jgi:hypothetical protein
LKFFNASFWVAKWEAKVFLQTLLDVVVAVICKADVKISLIFLVSSTVPRTQKLEFGVALLNRKICLSSFILAKSIEMLDTVSYEDVIYIIVYEILTQNFGN